MQPNTPTPRTARALCAALALAAVLAPASQAQQPGQRTTRLDSSTFRVGVPDTTGPSIIERGDTLIIALSREAVSRFARLGVPARAVDTMRVVITPDTVALLVPTRRGRPLRRELADPVTAYMYRQARDATRAMRDVDALLEYVRAAAGDP